MQRKTKIVATIGPASGNSKTLSALIDAGLNVARINFSHGTHESNGAYIRVLQKVSRAKKVSIAILQDLSGPKIRIGDFAAGMITLKTGQTFTLTTEKIAGDEKRVSVSYAGLPREVRAGLSILLDDGKLRLEILSTTKTEIVSKVLNGGTIVGRRGVNVPGAYLSLRSLTEKDRKDLEFGLASGVDMVALSFVRTVEDIEQLKKLLGKKREEVSIIAKIETAEAMEHLDAIIAAADGIMVARGDLAIEIPKQEVPLAQKTIIEKCNRAGKPVITATQMLESMITTPSPTRAEVNDVANAILDGTDAVMLSAESATGAYPLLAVETMHQVALETENSEWYRRRLSLNGKPKEMLDAVTTSIVNTAEAVQAKAIVAFSESGTTGRMISRHKPAQPIIVLTPNKKTFSQALLSFGCQPTMVPWVNNLKKAMTLARKILLQKKLAKKGDSFVLAAGWPLKEPGPTNSMVVQEM